MSKTSEQTKVYFEKRLETLHDPARYKTCQLSQKTILRFLKHHNFKKQTGKYLDIGCGDRVLCNVFQDHGWDAHGLDISDGINFETDTIPFDDNSFALITLYGVIEHISNPHLLLTEIYRLLENGGACVIITPNIKSEGLSFFDDPDHKKPYTPRGLSWLMQMYGFNSRKIGLWTVRKPSFLWGLSLDLQFMIGKLIPFYGRNKYVPNFLKGRSKTMIGSFLK